MQNQQELPFVELVKLSGVALYGLLSERDAQGATIMYMTSNDPKDARSIWIPTENIDQIGNMDLNEAPWNRLPPGVDLVGLCKALDEIRKNTTVDGAGDPKVVTSAWNFINSTLETVDAD